MNPTSAFLAKNPQYKAYSCAFPGSARKYTYISQLDLKRGDKCVVEAPNTGYAVVTVESANGPIMDNANIIYKWIVQVADFTAYDGVKNLITGPR